jgi:hypothetical protein
MPDDHRELFVWPWWYQGGSANPQVRGISSTARPTRAGTLAAAVPQTAVSACRLHRPGVIKRRTESVAFDLKVVAGLQIHPEPLRGPGESCQTQSGVGSDATLGVNDLVDAPRRDIQLL